MGAEHAKQSQLGHFGEGVRIQKKYQLEQFIESKVMIYPPPDAQFIKTRCQRPTRLMMSNAQQAGNELALLNSDGRIQVLNTDKWPHSVHGVFAFKFDKMSHWGTGILIGPKVVLTAGHNLYHHPSQTYANLKSLTFVPGLNSKAPPFGLVEVEKYYVSPNYTQEEREDYGILILKKPIGEQTGYFGLACLGPEEIESKKINVTGYPGDKVASKPGTYEMWGMEGTASYIDQTRGEISYLISTGAGQTGSGVWYQEGEDYYVCGVHVRGNLSVSTGTLLTRAVYKQIYNWLHDGSNGKWLSTLDSIEKLEFEDFQIDTEHLLSLVEYNLENLATMNLFSKKITPQGARILARNTLWIKLSMLDLYNNQIGPEGCKALAENTSWINLSWLNLNRNNIGTEGAIALARNVSWKNLSKLHLENNNIEPEGAMALAQNTSWTQLTYLNLANNSIDDEGAEALAKNPAWRNLKSLDLKNNEITPEAEAEIARMLTQDLVVPNENTLDTVHIFW